VNKVEPGLVVITTTMQYNGQDAAGTGMIISPGGLVLTNNHVIEDSTKLSATVMATGKTYPATVVGYDKTGDIALIRLQGASGLTTGGREPLARTRRNPCLPAWSAGPVIPGGEPPPRRRP
jgi:S1-C subfamily serine protease